METSDYHTHTFIRETWAGPERIAIYLHLHQDFGEHEHREYPQLEHQIRILEVAAIQKRQLPPPS